MLEKERVEKIRSHLKFNKKTFSEVLGYTYPQQYTKYLKGNNSLSIKAMKALIGYDKRFNINWILIGEGEMLLNDTDSNSPKNIYGDGNTTQVGHNNELNSNSNNVSVNSTNNELEYLKKEIQSLNKEIKSLNQVIESKDEIIQLLKR